MRTETVTINIYQFAELSVEGQEKAINNLFDINVDHDWWDFTYEDAERIGLKITSFDLDRYRHCKGEFIESAVDVAKAILAEHGEHCDTYRTAQDYLIEYKRSVIRQCQDDADMFCVPGSSSGYSEYCDYCNEIDTEDIDLEFLKSLLEDYSMMLQRECDYLTSEKAIIETIEANEYEFTANGKLY